MKPENENLDIVNRRAISATQATDLAVQLSSRSAYSIIIVKANALKYNYSTLGRVDNLEEYAQELRWTDNSLTSKYYVFRYVEGGHWICGHSATFDYNISNFSDVDPSEYWTIYDFEDAYCLSELEFVIATQYSKDELLKQMRSLR